MTLIPAIATTLELEPINLTTMSKFRAEQLPSMMERLQKTFATLMQQNMQLESALIAAQSREREYTSTQQGRIAALKGELSSLQGEQNKVEREIEEVNKREHTRKNEIKEGYEQTTQEMQKMQEEKIKATIEKINAIFSRCVQEAIRACSAHIDKINIILDEGIAFAKYHGPAKYFPDNQVGSRFKALKDAYLALYSDPAATWASNLSNTWQ